MAKRYYNSKSSKASNWFYSAFLFFNIFRIAFVWMFTHKKKHPVKTYTDIKEIPKALRYGDDYKYDPPNRDPVYHPTRIQERIDAGTKIGDCDDHAIYWCVALVKSKLAKRVWFSTYFWEGGEGHAICVFEGLDGELYWGDYGNPTPVKFTKIDLPGVPENFGWVYTAMKNYGAKQVSTAQMWEVKRINWRDVPRLKLAHWVQGPITVEDFEVTAPAKK